MRYDTFNPNSLIWPNNARFRLIWGSPETYNHFIENGGTQEEYEMIALKRKMILDDVELLNYNCEVELPKFEPKAKGLTKGL